LRKGQGFNPFYFLLVLAGVTFVVTAFACGLMAYASIHGPAAGSAGQAGHPLWRFLRAHGNTLLVGEMALVGALAVAAMGTDRYWIERARRPKREEIAK